jgi:aminocarboxymuconate-semialdehyde decarboxylase
MHIIDSHFHWWPRAFFDMLCERTDYPRAERNARGGYNYYRKAGEPPRFALGPEWCELEEQLAHMDGLGHEVDVICSIGPLSIHFSDLPVEEGRAQAELWNEQMAWAQRTHPGRIWASAAIPLVDTDVAIDVLENAVRTHKLVGVNLPGSVGDDPRIDADRLEPFYARVAELGLPMFLHPTDAIFAPMLDEDYGGALHLSLGRVIEVSVAAMRLVYSGLMERHPDLKIYMSHTGGALPYQAGRMDKNGKAAKLPHPPSDYIRRMYTDVVSPHMAGMKFAVEFYGVDKIIYGSDYPCWSPADALRLFAEIGLSAEDQRKILYDNARRVFGLDRDERLALTAAA